MICSMGWLVKKPAGEKAHEILVVLLKMDANGSTA